tara:strand:+ start:1168 stop:2175 length:1008 start_codon:yes stop_codon:yes gene_type:complete
MQSKFEIDGKIIGSGYPPYVIAEAGSNFNQSLTVAKQLIDVAVDAKADAIKFQLFSADSLYSSTDPEYKLFKQVELNREWIPELYDYANSHNITFLASSFDKKSVDVLENVNIAAHKIASSETTNASLMAYIASKGRPIILSTGMCDLIDVQEAVNICKNNGCDSIAILQCSTIYPLPIEQANVSVIDLYQKIFSAPVGFSDHTMSNIASISAVAKGANVIEKHFTLDKSAEGPDHFYALEPDELKIFISSLHDAYSAIGNSKKDLLGEEREFGRREGIYAAKNIKKGEKITLDNIYLKRPALGLRSRYINTIQGAYAKKNISAEDSIDWDAIEF